MHQVSTTLIRQCASSSRKTLTALLHPSLSPGQNLSLTPRTEDPKTRSASSWTLCSDSLGKPPPGVWPLTHHHGPVIHVAFVFLWLYRILFSEQATTFPPRIHTCNKQPGEAASLYCVWPAAVVGGGQMGWQEKECRPCWDCWVVPRPPET